MRNTHTTAMFSIISYILSSLSPCFFISTAVFIVTRKLVLRYFITPRIPKNVKYPPKPHGSEYFLGHMRKLGPQAHLKFTEYGNELGPIFQISLGLAKIVVINDYNLIRKAFRQETFSGRPSTALTDLLQGRGIINSYGPLWEEQRNFLHGVLRTFGAKNMGKNRIPMERNMQTQVDQLLVEMYATNGAPCNMRPKIARSVSNVVGLMLMGVTFDSNNEAFMRLVELIEEGFTILTTAVPVNYLPHLKYVPYANRGFLKIKQNKAETEEYFRKIVEEHKRTFDPNNIRDFVDAFYAEKLKADSRQQQNFFSDKQLLQVMGDVYSAGLETVTSTLEWAILFLVRNPEVQERMFEEIDQVIGQDRKPGLDDMPHMPYTEATFLEVQRRATVIPLGNPHATLEHTKLGGYFIEKGTHVISNLWAVHMDPNLWEAPEEFNPERFLVDDRVVKPPYFMPFSVGRRMCVGDTLAKMEVFLFLTSLVQKFKLCVPEGQEPPSQEGQPGISLTAKPFNVSVIPRN